MLATILRAGGPLHQGMLNYFDHAENAFVSAFRKYERDGTFEIQIDYLSSPELDGKTLILQPMSRQDALRKALEEMGLRIEQERLVSDSGRIYSILLAKAGAPDAYTEAEYFTGRYALVSEEELFSEFLAQWEEKLDKALAGLSAADDQRHFARAGKLRVICDQLRQMRNNYDKGI